MKRIQEGSLVRFHYTGYFPNGEVFDTSEGMEPLEIQVGFNQIIPGLENQMIGMVEGEKKEIFVPYQDAYGEYREDLVVRVPRANLPEGFPAQPGLLLELQGEDGSPFTVTISDVTEEEIVLDANHPLAGKDLIFRIEIISVE